jgi:uncharacterized protein (TIGR03085 family)
MGVAQTERRLLCELFDQVGPDSDTLCAGWRTRDLAAHLVLRERRLDAAPGILLKPLAGHTRRVQDGFAARPWAELVDLVRSGPPSWSPYGVGSLDELVNAAEFFVHHEDVRRAQPDWEPRPPDPARDEALWRAVGRIGRIAYRNSPVGVALRRPDGTEQAVKRGPRTVRITGEPGELLFYSFGRDQARLEFDGEQPAVATVQGLKRGF